MEYDARFHWAEGLKYVAEGIKATFLLNGVAAVSVLTFFGNHLTAIEGQSRSMLVIGLMIFSAGALFAPFSYMTAYLTQLQYGNGNIQLAWRFHRLTYILFFGGVLCFPSAVAFAGLGLLNAPAALMSSYSAVGGPNLESASPP